MILSVLPSARAARRALIIPGHDCSGRCLEPPKGLILIVCFWTYYYDTIPTFPAVKTMDETQVRVRSVHVSLVIRTWHSYHALRSSYIRPLR